MEKDIYITKKGWLRNLSGLEPMRLMSFKAMANIGFYAACEGYLDMMIGPLRNMQL